MKITLKSSNNITSEQVKAVIDRLNKDYSDIGLTVKNMTLYVRFADETGQIVEPVKDGNQIERTFIFSKRKEVTKKEQSA